MKVWRVDHATLTVGGVPIGPYRHTGDLLPEEHAIRLSDMAWDHGDRAHMCPFRDLSLLGIDPNEFCGFDSEKALYDWFANWTAALDAAGFAVRTYEVPDAGVRCGANGQVVFYMGAARLLEAAPLDLGPVQLEIPGVNL